MRWQCEPPRQASHAPRRGMCFGCAPWPLAGAYHPSNGFAPCSKHRLGGMASFAPAATPTRHHLARTRPTTAPPVPQERLPIGERIGGTGEAAVPVQQKPVTINGNGPG